MSRRKAEDIKELTREALLNKIYSIQNQRDRALAAFIYLTGCRISEILGKTKIIKTKQNGEIHQREAVIPPIMKEDVEKLTEDIILIHNVPSLKWREKIPRRNIPLKISSDKEFIKVFIEYYNTLPNDSPLFSMTRQRAWQIINKELGVFTHFLIHQRCTDLVVRKGFTDLYLKRFRGWRDTRPAEVYTHLNWEDLAQKM